MPISNPGVAPAASLLVVAETEVYSGVSPTTWTDLDLSATIGAQASDVLLKVVSGSVKAVAFRKNGDTGEYYCGVTFGGIGVALGDLQADIHHAFLVTTDNAGISEWKSESAVAMTIAVIRHFKPA